MSSELIFLMLVLVAFALTAILILKVQFYSKFWIYTLSVLLIIENFILLSISYQIILFFKTP